MLKGQIVNEYKLNNRFGKMLQVCQEYDGKYDVRECVCNRDKEEVDFREAPHLIIGLQYQQLKLMFGNNVHTYNK